MGLGKIGVLLWWVRLSSTFLTTPSMLGRAFSMTPIGPIHVFSWMASPLSFKRTISPSFKYCLLTVLTTLKCVEGLFLPSSPEFVPLLDPKEFWGTLYSRPPCCAKHNSDITSQNLRVNQIGKVPTAPATTGVVARKPVNQSWSAKGFPCICIQREARRQITLLVDQSQNHRSAS